MGQRNFTCEEPSFASSLPQPDLLPGGIDQLKRRGLTGTWLSDSLAVPLDNSAPTSTVSSAVQRMRERGLLSVWARLPSKFSCCDPHEQLRVQAAKIISFPVQAAKIISLQDK